MKSVVDRADDPLLAPDPLPPAVAPPARARFAAVAILSGLAAGALTYALLLADAGWPALVLLLSLGLSVSSLAAMLVFRRLQLPFEAAQQAQARSADTVADPAAPVPEAAAPLPAANDRPLAEAAQQIARLEARIAALTATGDAVLLVAADGRIELASPAAADLIGQTPEALVDRSFATLFPLFDDLRPEPLQHPLTASLQRLWLDPRAEPLACAALLERRGRTSVPMRLVGVPIRGEAGEPSRGARLTLLPRTMPAPAQATPRGPAGSDSGLDGLDRLRHRIEALQVESRLDGGGHGLLLIAVDDAERLPARLGLVAAAQRRWLVGRTLDALLADPEARLPLGAGQHAVLLPRAEAAHCARQAVALCAAVAALPPALAGDPGMATTIGIGWVWIDAAPKAADALIDAAQAALRQAQSDGVGQIRQAVAPASAAGSGADEPWLQRRLAERALRLVAEPIMASGSATPAGGRPWVELLPRIEDDDGVWLPLANHRAAIEALGLAASVELAVLDAALAQGVGDRMLLIRLSSAALARPDFAAALAARLQRSALPAGRLVLGVDAAFVLAQPQRSAALREQVLALGVELLIDGCREADEVAALRLLPAPWLRLAASVDATARAPLEALVAAARAAGATVLAREVRDTDARERLRLAGVTYVQGPAVAPPTPYST